MPAPPSPITDDDFEGEAAGTERLTFAIEGAQAGQRLDKFLAAECHVTHAGDLSRSRLKTLIEEGAVTIGDAPATDPARKLRIGETVLLALPPPVAATPVAEAIALSVLYEDEALIVIDKPAGMVVHPSAGHERGTLVNALLHHCGESLSGINGVLRPGIVHRLDKDTSGVMVVAKTNRAHKRLAAQFADHGREGPLERAYLAIAWGVPHRRAFTIDAPIARSTANREKMVVVRGDSGRFAITHIELLESFAGAGNAPVASLLECRLETGRTHQIRVHLAHVGHPLLGDGAYGTGFRTKMVHLGEAPRAALEALNRQALHAALLAFEHPATGETMHFESPPPADFSALLTALRG